MGKEGATTFLEIEDTTFQFLPTTSTKLNLSVTMEAGPEIQQRRSMSSQATPVASPKTDSTMKSPIEDRTFPGHDSMVTVRLSEPPSLSVNTDLPPNALPSRRSIFGPECTPTSATAVATPMKEDVSPAGEEDCESPEANTESQSTLADELGDSISSPDDQSESPRNSVSTVDSDTEDEEVNWEKLQQTEDEEVKDQDDNDNVCYYAPIHNFPSGTPLGPNVNIPLEDGSNENCYYSLQPCF